MSDPFEEPTPAGKPDSDFFASGSPSCRFNNIGDVHQGEILNFEEAQQRDIQTNKPKFWPDGNPALMLVITLQTTERDPDIDDDDGTRRLYVNKPSGMFAAIKTAIGKSKFAVGGKLAVKYIKNGTPKTPGFSPPKEYVAKYTPPGVAEPTNAPVAAKPNGNGGNGGGTSEKVLAWGAFQEKVKEYNKEFPNDAYNTAKMQAVFKSFIEEIFPGKDPKQFTEHEWAIVGQKMPEFDAGTGGTIPF